MADLSKFLGAAIGDLTSILGASTGDLTSVLGLDVPAVGAPATVGYHLGGTTTATNSVTAADRLVFATETTSAATALPAAESRGSRGAIGDGSVGYYCRGGGLSGSVEVRRYTIATEAAASIAATRIQTYAPSGLGSGSTGGYFHGGSAATGGIVTATSISISTEALATVASAALAVGSFQHHATYAAATHGYIMGGFTSVASLATRAKVTYASDTLSALSALSTVRRSTTSFAGPDRVWACRGLAGSVLSSTEHTAIATDALSAGAAMPSIRLDAGATRSGTAAYCGLGLAGLLVGDRTTAMDRYIFASDATANVAGAAGSVARWGVSEVMDTAT